MATCTLRPRYAPSCIIDSLPSAHISSAVWTAFAWTDPNSLTIPYARRTFLRRHLNPLSVTNAHFHDSKSLAVIKLWNGEAIGSSEPDKIDKSSIPDCSTESRRQKSEGMIKSFGIGRSRRSRRSGNRTKV